MSLNLSVLNSKMGLWDQLFRISLLHSGEILYQGRIWEDRILCTEIIYPSNGRSHHPYHLLPLSLFIIFTNTNGTMFIFYFPKYCWDLNCSLFHFLPLMLFSVFKCMNHIFFRGNKYRVVAKSSISSRANSSASEPRVVADRRYLRAHLVSENHCKWGCY